MALFLEKTLYNTKTVRYHRISEIESRNLTGRVKVESFPSFDERATQHNSRYFKWYPIQWQSNYDFAREAYEQLKGHPDFAGAIDA